ncbi:MAG: efflux RND transporter periplasmic adaptor subunit [Pseudomonadota bacterium]
MKVLAPILILIVLLGVGVAVLQNPPEAQRRSPPQGPKLTVETMVVLPRDYQVIISSFGTVQPRTQSQLVAQVGGQVTEVQISFRPGEFFATGDVLLTIDPQDYEADVRIAEAALLDAIQAEAQEAARAEQALNVWESLGEPDKEPTPLVLREPQLAAAKARVISAKANLTKAELDLARTQIKAPFSGRILQQYVDLGQVVTPGTQLAEIYATDLVEIRLPIQNSDLAYIDLPDAPGTDGLDVRIRSDLGRPQSWDGRIVRTEGAIDQVARQLHVIAEISQPFTATESRRALKIGEYVTAEVSGLLIPQAIVIPANTVYQNSYIYVVEHHNDTPVLQRREISIAWQNGQEVVVQAGLQSQDVIVTTTLGSLTSGTPVRLASNTEKPMTDGRALEQVAQ